MNDHFSPKIYFQNIIHRWWLPVFLMTIGGMVGLFAGKAIPVEFEAISPIMVTIDYTRTGALSDIQEDQAMRSVGSIIESAEVLNKLVQELKKFGIYLDEEEISRSLTLERENFCWLLIARNNNVENANLLVDTWSKVAVSTINQALFHSERVYVGEKALAMLGGQLGRATTGKDLEYQILEITSDSLIKNIQALSEYVANERSLSKALLPALSVFPEGRYKTAAKVVRFDQGLLIASGMSIGLILSLLIIFNTYTRPE